jgi:ABC-type uncharacterized transport system YnjBCD ATPase subunit
MSLTLTDTTRAEFAKVLEIRKSVLLEGRNAYLDQAAMFAAVRAIDMLMQDNPVATGLKAMQEEVDAIEADIDGEFARMRVTQAIEADLHNDANKAHVAHLKQTLNAVRLERQHAQGAAA